MPIMIGTDLLRKSLEPPTHELMPEARSGLASSINEVAMFPLAVLSIAHSMKRQADVLERICDNLTDIRSASGHIAGVMTDLGGITTVIKDRLASIDDIFDLWSETGIPTYQQPRQQEQTNDEESKQPASHGANAGAQPQPPLGDRGPNVV